MGEVFKTVLSLSVSGSALLALLWAARPLYRRRLSWRWQYYVWLIVVARLLLPVSPPVSLVGTAFQSVEAPAGKGEALPSSLQVPEEPAIPEEEGSAAFQGFAASQADPLSAAGVLWLVGAAVMLARKITVYQGFVSYLKAGWVEASDLEVLERFGRVAARTGVRRPVRLYVNPLISSPLLVGLLRPCVVLPSLDMPRADFENAVLHELIHERRGDLFYQWLVQLAVCVHWFNPLIHWMAREIGRGRELSCDEAAVRGMDREGAAAYGDTLVRALGASGSFHGPASSVTLSGGSELLKERLEVIMTREKGGMARSAASVLAAMCLIFGAAATGSYAAPSQGASSAPARQEANAAMAEARTVLELRNHPGQKSISESGQFTARGGETLTLTVSSTLRGGSADLFLFDPQGRQAATVSFSGGEQTRQIPLTAGTWAYNCTGMFQGGDLHIVGTASASEEALPSLYLDVRSASVEVVSGKDGGVSAEYDPETYQVEVLEEENGWVVNVQGKPGNHESRAPVRIAIPDRSYGGVTLDAQSAALEWDVPRSGEITATLRTASATLTLPKGFRGSLRADAADSYVKLHSADRYRDSSVSVTSDSPMKTPLGFEVNGGVTAYENGTGENVIEVTASGGFTSLS